MKRSRTLISGVALTAVVGCGGIFTRDGVTAQGATTRRTTTGYQANRAAATSAVQPTIYGSWRAAKIGGGGFLQNVVFTSNPQVLYAYADVAGPWRSDDGGQTWRALYGNLPPLTAYGVRGLLVDPRDPDKIMVGRGGGQWSVPDGLYISNDGGKSWKKTLTAPFNANEANRASGFLLARHPKNPDEVIAAAGHEGVFRSRDNGKTWQKLGQEGLYPTEIRYDRRNPQRIWLSAQARQMWITSAPGQSKQQDFAGGLFRSDDGGQTWQKLADEAPTELLQHPTDASRLFGLFDKQGVKLSRDGGATWQALSDGLPAQAEHWMDRVNALAAGPDFIVTATQRGNFFRMGADDTKWQKIERQSVEEVFEGEEWYGTMKGQKPGAWQHFGAALGSISIDPRNPNHWWFTDWYAAYRSTDAGRNWKLSMNGIELTVLHALAQDPTDPGVVHMGMADNGYLWSENGGERFYTPKITANMKAISLSPKLPSRLYGVGDGIGGQWSSNQVFVSVDRGKTWTKSPMQGLPDTKEFKCNTIVVDPTGPYRVYLAVSKEVAPGKGGVYKSIDGGKSWTWMGQGLPTSGGQFFRDDIWGIGRELAIATNGDMLAISRDRRVVYRFDRATDQWVNSGLKLDSAPHSVAADILKPGRFFVGVSGHGVYRTTDGGQSWTRVLERGTEHVAVDVAKPNRVAAGTFDGVYWSEDGGTSWKPLDQKLPHRKYSIPAFVGDRVIVGTGGSGAYWMPLTPQAALPIRAKPAQAAALAGASTQQVGIANGDMSEGIDAPTGWRIGWTGSGKLNLMRDTQSFASAPAALRLESVGDAAYGNAGQSLAVTGTPFTISGVVKSSGTLKEARIAVQAFDAQFKQVAFINLADAVGAADWKEFSSEVSLPADAKTASLTVVLNGQGRVWLDDVRVESPQNVFLADASSR